MYRLDLTLVDCRIIGTRAEDTWIVEFHYAMTGEWVVVQWTDTELATVLSVTLSDDGNGTHPLYATAAALVAKFPSNCRPIP
jgi:hypothetical protein